MKKLIALLPLILLIGCDQNAPEPPTPTTWIELVWRLRWFIFGAFFLITITVNSLIQRKGK